MIRPIIVASVAVCRLAIFSMLFLLGSLQNLEAQEQVSVGARVRITAPYLSKRPLVGTVVTAGADTLKVRLESNAIPLAIPLGSVTRLDVSSGKKRNAGKGALIGLFVGGVAGAVVWAAYGERELVSRRSDEEFLFFSSTSDWFSCTIGGCAAFLGGVGLVVGNVLGGIIKTEKWKPVSLERMAIGITPQRHSGLALSASFAF